MTPFLPDALDRTVDHLIWRMEVAGVIDLHPEARDRLHAILREALREKGLDPFGP